MPDRNGDWIFLTSAEEDAPQRTASKNAFKRTGESKPVGSGNATFSIILAPGSSSQTTCSSSPRPSSSIDDKLNKFWPLPSPLRVEVGKALGSTSFTIQLRDRTVTSCPCSGVLIVEAAMIVPFPQAYVDPSSRENRDHFRSL